MLFVLNFTSSQRGKHLSCLWRPMVISVPSVWKQLSHSSWGHAFRRMHSHIRCWVVQGFLKDWSKFSWVRISFHVLAGGRGAAVCARVPHILPREPAAHWGESGVPQLGGKWEGERSFSRGGRTGFPRIPPILATASGSSLQRFPDPHWKWLSDLEHISQTLLAVFWRNYLLWGQIFLFSLAARCFVVCFYKIVWIRRETW